MQDEVKTKEQLITELHVLRRRLAESEKDKTERNRPEESLIELESKFKSFAEQAITGINIIQDGVFKYVNPKFAQMFGYTVEECLSDMSFKNLVHAEDLATVKEHVRRRLSDEAESVHYTFRGLKKNGQIFPLETYGSTIVYKGKPAATSTTLDITERKRAEDELRESGEKYRRIFETANEGICVADGDYIVTSVNQKMADILGYLPQEVIGKPLGHFMFPQDLADHRKKISYRVKGLNETYECRFRRRNGGECWTNVSATAIRTEDGRFMGSFAMVTDTTEHKRAEAMLASVNRQNELLLNSVGDGIYGLDLEGRTTFVNPKAVNLVGYNLEEMMGRPQHDLIHHTKSDGSPYRREECPIYATFKDGQVHHVETEVFWRKDGTSFPVAYTSTPIHDENGELQGAVAVFSDITERKRLEEGQSRLAAIVESSDVAIIGKTLDGVVTSWNRGAEEIYGYTAEEVVGRSISVLTPNDRPDEVPAMLQRISRGEDVKHHETLRRGKDGLSIHVSLSISAIKDTSGKIVGASTIARDITERKQMEIEREKFVSELQEALARIKVLSGLLPICANCKKIRDDQGYWRQIEVYIRDHSDAEFSHGICPGCAKKLYPELFDEMYPEVSDK
ncbi:MAG: PAS domain S-box protein [Syntrophobacteraceae bacterium]